MSDRLEWRQEAAKGGGVDYVAGPFLIQDDLDNGGWTLRLDALRAATLDDAKALAHRVLLAISDDSDDTAFASGNAEYEASLHEEYAAVNRDHGPDERGFCRLCSQRYLPCDMGSAAQNVLGLLDTLGELRMVPRMDWRPRWGETLVSGEWDLVPCVHGCCRAVAWSRPGEAHDDG